LVGERRPPTCLADVDFACVAALALLIHHKCKRKTCMVLDYMTILALLCGIEI
jgi:hypothetical protein